MKLAIARFTLELLSPLHIGSGLADPATDAPVVRDAFGDYRIPGSSLAGALRAATGSDPRAWGEGAGNSTASSIEVSDGYLVDFDGVTTLKKRLASRDVAFPVLQEIHDHVRIEHRSGTAEEGGKFDNEVVPQGARFRCEVTWVGRPGAAHDAQQAAHLAFRRSIGLLRSSQVALGGDVCSGLGVVRILPGSLSIGSHDLTTLEGVTAARNRSADIDEPAGEDPITSDSESALPEQDHPRDGITGIVRLGLRCDGPLLIGGSQRPSTKNASSKNFGADLVFGESLVADYSTRSLLTKPRIPGSSVRGVLRHRAWQVLEALGLSAGDAQSQIEELFGSVSKQGNRASRVRVHGCILDDKPRALVQHVAIDRLTGGSLKGALYSEAPIWVDGLQFDLTISIHGVTDAQAVAVGHALIDLSNGELPIGAGSRRGNGRVHLHKDAAGWHGKAVKFELHRGGRTISEKSDATAIDDFINHLEAANTALAGARR